MYQINFNKPVKIHFMGIGGISMSGLAEILHAKGFTVVGSDAHESAITDHLTSLGIQIAYGQRAENITPDIDVVVYTAAIHPDNPEFAAAKSAGLPMMDRAELLAQIMTNYTNAIAVSGTHGKTTTTSMLSHILLAADTDPTISVGGILKAIHGNIRVGHSDNFITEACEYTNSFLKFNPSLEIILNIEEDHLDFFKDINDIRHSFRKFAEKLDADDILVINGEISHVSEITDGLPCHIITYGLKPECDYAAENITFDEFAKGSFDLIAYGKEHPSELMAGMQNGSSTQLIEVLFEKEFDFQATMVDAGSNADKVTALMGNQIDYCFMNTTGNDQYVQSGDLKCLVAWGGKGCKRSSIIPDTPTLEEIYPDENMPRLDMYGYIAGPAGMSDELVQTINDAIKVAQELLENGYVSGRPYMGITYLAVTDAQTAAQLNVNAYGVYVVDVVQGGPADKAGLKTGDRIVSIDGTEIAQKDDLGTLIQQHAAGDTLSITVAREGQMQTVSLTLGEKNAQTQQAQKNS